MKLLKPYIIEGIRLYPGTKLEEKERPFNYLCLDMNKVLGSEYDEQYHNFQSQLDPNLIYTEPDGYGLERYHHITIFYGLVQDSFDIISEFIKTLGPISIYVGDITFFRNEDKPYDVMKFEIRSDGLEKIFHFIKNNLENDYNWDEFKPHMTVSYIKKDAFKEYENENLVPKLDFQYQEFKVNEILYQDKLENKFIIYV